MKALAIGDAVKVTSTHAALIGARGVVVDFGWQKPDDVWVMLEPYRPTDMVPLTREQLRRLGPTYDVEGLARGSWLLHVARFLSRRA